MERTIPWKTRLAGVAAAVSIRSWMRTLNYRALFADPAVDPIHPSERPRIYVLWHEYLLLPLYLRGHCNLSMLLSKHRDADILDCLAIDPAGRTIARFINGIRNVNTRTQ